MPSVVNQSIYKEVSGEFENNAYIFVSNFADLSMDELSDLRRSLEKVASRSVVVKHSIANKIFGEMEFGDISGYSAGHLLMTLGDADPQNISKAIVEYAKKNDKFVPRAVVFEKKLYDESFVKSLAKMPSRKELLTQVVVRVKSPISGFVMSLGQMVKGLAVALNEIKKQKEAAA